MLAGGSAFVWREPELRRSGSHRPELRIEERQSEISDVCTRIALAFRKDDGADVVPPRLSCRSTSR
jgi:hypothetical protein